MIGPFDLDGLGGFLSYRVRGLRAGHKHCGVWWNRDKEADPSLDLVKHPNGVCGVFVFGRVEEAPSDLQEYLLEGRKEWWLREEGFVPNKAYWIRTLSDIDAALLDMQKGASR